MYQAKPNRNSVLVKGIFSAAVMQHNNVPTVEFIPIFLLLSSILIFIIIYNIYIYIYSFEDGFGAIAHMTGPKWRMVWL